MTRLVVCAPMRVEARALCKGSDHLTVRHTGTGPARGRGLPDGDAVVVAGIGGGLSPDLRTGDVVVATEIWSIDGDRPIELPDPTGLAQLIRAHGLTVHTRPVVSARKIARGATRDRLAATGASIVDTESYWMLRPRDPARSWCVRVVADAAPHRVLTPLTLLAVRAALGRLPAVGAALGEFSEPMVREVRADGGTAAASR